MSPTNRRLALLLTTLLLAAGCSHEDDTPARAPDPAPPVVTTPTTAPPDPPPAPAPEKATAHLLLLGDTFWGRFVEEEARASGLGAAHPFSRLDELHRDRYDAWIANLECPVVPGLDVPAAEQDRLLSFNCEPDFLDEAAAWFTAFSLANNHTDNQGRDGLERTREVLAEHGIQHFGDADPRQLDHVCNVVAVPVRVALDDGSRTRGRLPLALCGFDGVFRVPSEKAVARLEAYAELLPTIAMPHNGLEYTSTPDSIKVAFARSLVDHGADLVVGSHPHWVQPAEVYRGRLIAYSLGNFMFDQQYDAEVTRSAALEVGLATEDRNLARWLELGVLCERRHGDCLDEIRQADLPRPALDYSYDVVGTTNAGGPTRAATSAQTRAIKDRLDWAEVDAQLDGR